MMTMSRGGPMMANLWVLARAIKIVLRCWVGWMTLLCMIHRSWGGGSQIWTDPLIYLWLQTKSSAILYNKFCFRKWSSHIWSVFWMQLLVRVNLQSQLCIEHLTLQRGLYWQCSSEQNWWEKNKPCPLVRHLALHHRTPGSVHARLTKCVLKRIIFSNCGHFDVDVGVRGLGYIRMKHILTRNENSNDCVDGLVAEFLDMLGDGEAGQCTAVFVSPY